MMHTAWLAILLAFGHPLAPPAHHAPRCRLISTHVGAALGGTVTERTYRCGSRLVVRQAIEPTPGAGQ